MKKILIACEESQTVCKAFRARGFEAYSCDIQDCSGGHPEWHIKGDVLEVLNQDWDMIIAHPPCTDLAVSGAAWFKKKRENGTQEKSIEFFMKILNTKCPYLCVENPISIISGNYISEHFPRLQNKFNFPIKPTQIIHPWQFGHEAQKTTCLWIRGLPNLIPTKIVGRGEVFEWKDGKTGKIKRQPLWFKEARNLPKEERQRVRSKTFSGIAEAMAQQWGNFLSQQSKEKQ